MKSDKQDYVITEDAGKEVAGMKSPGKGKTVSLSPEQAEHPLRVGHIEKPSKKSESK